MLTEADVRRLLATQLPVDRLLLGDEFDTWAIGADLVAKFPLTEYDAAKVPAEVRAHPLLRELLGDVVPAIRDVRPPDGESLGYIVHERARGTQGQTNDGDSVDPTAGVARDIGRLLAMLHTVDATTARSLGLGERTVMYDMPELDERTIAAAAHTIGDDRLGAFLAMPPPAPSMRRPLCHTDLKGEHVFVADDRDRVTAIIDWADVEVCDPARDHAGLVIWHGPAFTATAVAAAGEDDDTLLERAIWLARAGMLEYWNDLLAGREHAPVALITRQLRTAFGD